MSAAQASAAGSLGAVLSGAAADSEIAVAARGGGGEPSVTALRKSDNFFFDSRRAVDATFESSYRQNLNPENGDLTNSVIFTMGRLSPGHCAFLREAEMMMMLRIVDRDGKKPPDDYNIAPIVNFPSAMFSDMRLFLNDVECSSSQGGTYPFRAHVSITLNGSAASRDTTGATYGQFEDGEGMMENYSALNDGFGRRRAMFSRETVGEGGELTWSFYEEPVAVWARLFTDFNSCPVPLLSGVGAKLEMRLDDPARYMCTDSKDPDPVDRRYRLQIVQASLQVPVRVLNPSLNLDLERRLAGGEPVDYPLTRVESKRYTLPPNVAVHTIDVLSTTSTNPLRVLLALVPASRVGPDYRYNPLNCVSRWARAEGEPDCELIKATLSVNGTPVNPEPAAGHGPLISCMYRQLFRTLGQQGSRETCGLTHLDFISGYFFMFFDLSKSSRAFLSGVARQPTLPGHLRLELAWSSAPAEAMHVYQLSEFNARVRIDKNRNVAYSYLD